LNEYGLWSPSTEKKQERLKKKKKIESL